MDNVQIRNIQLIDKGFQKEQNWKLEENGMESLISGRTGECSDSKDIKRIIK